MWETAIDNVIADYLNVHLVGEDRKKKSWNPDMLSWRDVIGGECGMSWLYM